MALFYGIVYISIVVIIIIIITIFVAILEKQNDIGSEYVSMYCERMQTKNSKSA